jgi:hypothetical protein
MALFARHRRGLHLLDPLCTVFTVRSVMGRCLRAAPPPWTIDEATESFCELIAPVMHLATSLFGGL